jgi:inorganic pyrophosphatase
MDVPEPLAIPTHTRVRVEIPRWSFAKRGAEGVEFWSPLPCPFNYGSVPGTLAPDGDALDAIALGPTLPLGVEVELPVWGWVDFLDDGARDTKLLCGATAPSEGELLLVRAFFLAYAPARRLLNLGLGKRGPTRFGGVVVRTPQAGPA